METKPVELLRCLLSCITGASAVPHVTSAPALYGTKAREGHPHLDGRWPRREWLLPLRFSPGWSAHASLPLTWHLYPPLPRILYSLPRDSVFCQLLPHQVRKGNFPCCCPIFAQGTNNPLGPKQRLRWPSPAPASAWRWEQGSIVSAPAPRASPMPTVTLGSGGG